jgi:hypothetical protein
VSGLQNGRDPSRGDFDWRRFAIELRRHNAKDARGFRDKADEIGVTISDLSRAMGGQVVSAGRVIALCDWMGADVREFYIPPESPKKSACFNGRNVKHEVRA